MQAIARRVEAQRAVGAADVNVQFHVGVGDAYVRPFARGVAEVVNNRVLHLVGHELGVAELLGVDHAVDGKGGVHVEESLPVHAPHGLVHVVGVVGFEMQQRFEHTYGGAQTEVGSVHHGLVAAKRHHAVPYLHIVGTEFGEFLCEHFFKSLKGLGDEFKFLHVA